jgi:gliding motility-associated-like protein
VRNLKKQDVYLQPNFNFKHLYNKEIKMKKKLNLVLLIMSFVFFKQTQSQICLGQDTSVCPSQSVTISALCSGPSGPPMFLLGSMQQVNLSDDQYSGAINIGFPFTYYGTTYTQLVIASNNYLTFDLSQANGYSPWSIGNALPSAALPRNSIMGPYQDINPGLGGTIEYGVIGTAPNRKFVVRYNQVPMFSCSNDIFCSSIVLFEGSNNIELHIDNKPLCATWNSGVAIEGIQNTTGTIGTVVAGRNFPTQWTTFADAVRFVPQTTSSYTVSAIPYVPSLLASGIQWWDTHGNFLGTGFQITVNPPNDTTGYYLVYDQCFTASSGPGNTDTAWVYHYPLPQIVTTSTNINCLNPVGTATAVATGFAPFTYLWNDPLSQTTPTAINLAPGTYTVVVTDSNGCTNQAIAIVDSAAYTLTMGSDSVLCNGDTNGSAFVSILPLDPTVTYLWDVNAGSQTNDTATGLAAGNYFVIITDTLGCTDTGYVTVNEPLGFTVTKTIVNPLCNGNSNGSIVVNVSGGTPGYTYSWGSNQLLGLAAGSYPIVITDANNCTYTETFTLVNPPIISVTLDSLDASCGLNDGAVIASVAGGTPGYTYNWSPGGLGTDTLKNIGTGLYSVVVTDAKGCTGTASTFVNEVKGFNVDFSLSPTQGQAPLTVTVFDNTTNCVTYHWDFGNGDTSIISTPNPVVYNNDGTYTITLIACNSSGLIRCCDTITKTVVVESNSICAWSNVLTPNGDGSNDEFKVVCERIVEFEMVIFNRWGKEMFRTNDINNSWDGTNGGKDVPEGTYFFILNAKGFDDVIWTQKSSLTLIR